MFFHFLGIHYSHFPQLLFVTFVTSQHLEINCTSLYEIFIINRSSSVYIYIWFLEKTLMHVGQEINNSLVHKLGALSLSLRRSIN